jgi:hypothetical protein
MIIKNGGHVDMSSDIDSGPVPSDLASLGHYLNFSTEADSAAVLSALLDHYKRETTTKSPDRRLSVFADDVTSTDVVCVVALNTATEWISQSKARADALFHYDAFMEQVDEWTGRYNGDENMSPYVAGLQALLRMCMNSETPARVRNLQHERLGRCSNRSGAPSTNGLLRQTTLCDTLEQG